MSIKLQIRSWAARRRYGIGDTYRRYGSAQNRTHLHVAYTIVEAMGFKAIVKYIITDGNECCEVKLSTG